MESQMINLVAALQSALLLGYVALAAAIAVLYRVNMAQTKTINKIHVDESECRVKLAEANAQLATLRRDAAARHIETSQALSEVKQAITDSGGHRFGPP